MARFFLPPANWSESPVALDAEESKHAAQVLRMRAGDEAIVFDGAGRAANARFATVSRQRCELMIEEELLAAPELRPLELCVSVPKGKNMDLIVQKAVELGVQRIQPLVTEHSVVRFDARDAEKKRDKWQRTALEACKQCGQNVLPQVASPLPFKLWLEQRAAFAEDEKSIGIVASLAPGARPLKEVVGELSAGTATVSYLIGPEGDLSPAETEALLAAGFLPVTLGDIVLRVETAVLHLTSVLRYEFGA